MGSLLFLISSFVFSKVLFSKGNFFLFLLRAFGMLMSVMILFSLYFSYFSIPLNLYSFSVLLLGISFLLTKIFPEKFSFDFKKTFSPEGFCFCNLKNFLFVLIASLGLSLFYFDFSFQLPKFISVDAAVHHYMGKYVLENERLIFTQRDLAISDTDAYPFGTSVITSAFSKFIPPFPHLEKFQLFNILLFSLFNAYFILFIQRHFPFKSKLLPGVFSIFIVFGFFFNMMIMGFTSQLLGLYLILFFADTWRYFEKCGNLVLTASSSVVLSAILFTYIYWLPIALLFLFLENFQRQKNWFASLIKTVRKITPTLLVFFALSSPFIISLYQVEILKFAGDDGATYKIFFLNFILFLPFILLGLFNVFRLSAPKNSGQYFIFSSLVYFFALSALHFGTDLISEYAVAKSFYLAGPILYFLAFCGFDILCATLPNPQKNILKFFLIAIIAIFIFAPLLKKRDNFSEKRKASLRMNFWGTNGRIFDIFYFNAKSVRNNKKDKINLSQDKKDFIEKVSVLFEKENPRKIAVASDPESSLWLYSLSWIWPSEEINGSASVWENGLFDYAQWKKQRKSAYLIILDTKAGQEWTKRSDFNMEDYEVVYEKGKNYLLKIKEGGTL